MRLVVVLVLASLAACAPTRVSSGRCEVDCGDSACIELIATEGCPHAAELGDNLCEALRGLSLCCCEIDPNKLPAGDPRRGYPSPSILVDGRDIFGLEPRADGSHQCRTYGDGLPSAEAIRAAIRARHR